MLKKKQNENGTVTMQTADGVDVPSGTKVAKNTVVKVTATPASGYALASVVAYSRIAQGKHWLNDVIGGIGVGILSARIGYWLVPLERKLFRLPARESQKIAVAAMPYYDPLSQSAGAAVAISF